MPGFHKRTIRKLIRNKVDNLLSSIKDDATRTLLRENIIITGGCIASMMLGEKVNDYDVYFRTREAALAAAKHYVAEFNRLKAEKLAGPDGVIPLQEGVLYIPTVKEEERVNLNGETENRILIYMKSAGVAGENQETYEYFEQLPEEATEDFMASLATADDEVDQVTEIADLVKNPNNKYRPVFLTDNAITLTDKVQLIIRFYGSVDEIHKNYDFIHCTGVYDYRDDSLKVSPEMMESLLSKTLVYSGSLYPLASNLRTRKFIKRGWRISAGQSLKIMEQISRVDFNNVAQLKEQLMGVDVAYMGQLIQALNSRETGQRVDGTYLAALIDQIFED